VAEFAPTVRSGRLILTDGGIETHSSRATRSTRLLECKAGSRLDTMELVQLDHPEADSPEDFAAEMWELHERFGLRVLGGCCGTDDRHMRALGARMAQAGS
jgi:S-methylmethionine-dependent homocysteine/selenocysteine methylase